MSARRVGVFGGTFDPLHHAHLIVAAEAFEALDLDLLVFVPAADPPHKPGSVVASPDQRLRMLVAGIDDDPRFGIDDQELRRGGPSFTVETLRRIRQENPADELFFLLGADQFSQFDTWFEPVEIARLARLAVLARGGETVQTPGPYGGIEVQTSRLDISATELRRRAANGLSVRYFVPNGVWRIIEDEGLYRV